MFDFTSSIKLSSKEYKKYNKLRGALFACFVLLSVFFVQRFIFPLQHFFYNSSIDSLANTISKPYETKDGTSFSVATYGQFDTATIELILPKDSPKLPKDTSLSIKKSYRAFLSPVSTTKYTKHEVQTYTIDDKFYLQKDETLYPVISENAFNSYIFKNNTILPDKNSLPQNLTISKEVAGFAPATLISSKDAIYVTDGEKKHPFQDERAFKALGYNFDNVIKSTSQERALHKKAKLFTVRSTHPFGTIFYAEDTQHTFIFDDDTLNKIPTTSIALNNAIPTQEASKNTVSICTLKKSLLPRHYKCTADLKSIENFSGNTFQFSLLDAPNTQIQKSHIQLSTTPNKKSLFERIEAIKRKINTYYE